MQEILNQFGIKDVNSGVCGKDWIENPSGDLIESINPSTNECIAKVKLAGIDDYETVMKDAQEAFSRWRMVPAPQRGEIIRQIGEQLREYKDPLGKLVSLEMGKIYSEGLGEVQEMIDIADFAVGLSRQLYGKTMHSERPLHRMYEQWHPLGVVGIISAFNFPVAVWSWNAMIAGVCGNVMIWKPSEKTPLTSLAVQHLCQKVLKEHGFEGVMTLINAKPDPVGEHMINDRRIPLVSATGSCRMGRHVAKTVHGRLGKTILELGGNNGLIVMPDANLKLALRGVLFGAVGTAGQRCTSTRRLFVHDSIADDFITKLQAAYKKIPIGDPLDANTLMGPLIDADSVSMMNKAIQAAEKSGGKVLCSEKDYDMSGHQKGNFVAPTLIEISHDADIVHEETFAPILYVIRFSDFDEVMAWHNEVDQGLSSSVFTTNMHTMESFLSHQGSDCGIANINIGTSGAEIGGAFGGEKDTGGGREAGSDSWKAYMRRQTNTINWGHDLPLAQGVSFGD